MLWLHIILRRKYTKYLGGRIESTQICDQALQELSSVHLTQELDKLKYPLYNQYLSRDHFRLSKNSISQLPSSVQWND